MTIPGKALGAVGTGVGLLPGVSTNVVVECSLLAEPRRTVRTNKGPLPCVGANVHGQVVFPGGDVRAEGTVVELGGAGVADPTSSTTTTSLSLLPRL